MLTLPPPMEKFLRTPMTIYRDFRQDVFHQICRRMQARRQDFATGGAKITRGGRFFKYSFGCMPQPGGQT